ncbi:MULTISPECIES: MFS transporter [unclassified Frondihabitans]|uniref:MFS transporter n=1 Tax=unclassified Frondihabitans TaxID=2626248 RepID=UPI000F4E89B8|nr:MULTISPECIES: MFS transporter [unclassified Frondihabitans]RPE78689.1 EmrB/QacA subfamily drug resistance transporter [Frondihabitans sp. PhB153]RPF08970.1 EmrB/QacA subfamily drug resistance transporter [Frondihabitans sp. PhB161]
MTTTTSTPTGSVATTRTPGGAVRDHKWLILTVVGLAQLMVVLDATIVNIALPSAQSALGFTNDNRQWVVTAYSLAFGSLLLLGGRLSDIFGRKTTFIIGLIGFAVASVLGGAAESFGWLVAARALQGIFGALLAPSALGIMTTTFSNPKERAKAFAIFGAIAGSGAAVGLLLGGVLTEYTSWRFCLFVNVIFAAVALVGAVAFLKKRGTTDQKHYVDVPGVITVTLGLVGIVYGFSNAETNSWSDPITIICLAGGVVLLAAFVLIQSRVRHPLLPLRVILNRDRGGSYLVIGLAGIGMFAVFLFLTYYLELTLGFSSLKTGVAFLPMPLSIMLSATVFGSRLLPRVGPRLLIFVGGLLGAAGLALLSRIGLDTSYASTVLPGLIVMGLGMGLIFSSAMNTATSGVGREDAGVASATVNTMQQIGGSIGTALLSTLSAGAVTRYLNANGTSKIDQANAVLSGYHLSFWVSTGVFVIIAIIGGTVLQKHSVRQAQIAAAGTPSHDDVPVAAH